jgi:quercetin dioxygenase-like cupin family protein
MEIRRFGPGHRRPDGPPGTQGVTGQVIHQDGRGTVAELAFAARAMMAPHTNPNTTYFVVVSGGGFVQVADERARVGHGEAVVWPAGQLHGAWTDGTEMRALVVEFSGSEDDALELAGRVREGLSHSPAGVSERSDPVERGRGSLAQPPPPAPADRDESSGEPW